MSKFSAWAKSGTSDSNGIRLSYLDVEGSQQRQYIGIYPYESVVSITSLDVSSSLPDWPASHLTDGNPNSVWSSVASPQQSDQTITLRFNQRSRINYLVLTPRVFNAKAVCYPKAIELRQRDQDNVYLPLATIQLPDPGPNPGPQIIPFDATYTLDGVAIVGTELQPDQYNNYYFQLAEISVGYKSVGFDQDPIAAASAHPNCLFFLGDEPNGGMYFTADEYAYAYDKFYDLIKRGSPTARVSPAGFILKTAFQPAGGYADLFYWTKNAPVDEWRFNHFYYAPGTGENATDPVYSQWAIDIPRAAEWSMDHGAPMVLGSFGSPYTKDTVDMSSYQKSAMQLVSSDQRIVEAVWWSYNYTTNPPDKGSYHALFKYDGSGLTPDGQLFTQLM